MGLLKYPATDTSGASKLCTVKLCPVVWSEQADVSSNRTNVPVPVTALTLLPVAHWPSALSLQVPCGPPGKWERDTPGVNQVNLIAEDKDLLHHVVLGYNVMSWFHLVNFVQVL